MGIYGVVGHERRPTVLDLQVMSPTSGAFFPKAKVFGDSDKKRVFLPFVLGKFLAFHWCFFGFELFSSGLSNFLGLGLFE